ncbi:C40 family peptidase [bacterium]|nr:C40 family peptidase [bacterium]
MEEVGAAEPFPEVDPDQVTLGIEAASLARQQLGKQYQWGAAGPDRFDCSGLVHYVYSNLGIDLPRTSHRQAAVGEPVPRRELQPGDLLFFALNGSGIDHVGIYLGKQKFIHAPRRHQPVRTDSLNDTWWRRRLKEARRIP